ncbi:Cof-type HAD-IIB family hydrolase [Lactobacillus sp. ESL0230]|uniref:Cof-type HAD-IIB family hydrolase n=1 Tax=Lactobacillus sp. ESL0230 TaxID=2069353 RepID=UPI000EFBDE6C|nr:HAD family hydrolase [Lactobacillus sp. ESL0230]RMC46419.1 HAD family phosphatase [Lactobacillus sp. ESL0230]
MIKLIATDMDGTWLTDEKTYDHELFLREFELMKKRNIKFVVASGNQFENIYQRFPEVASQIYFVAENGALVAHGRQVMHTASISETDWQTLLEIINRFDEKVTVSGLASAYVLTKDGKAYAQELKKYYEKLTLVANFEDLADKIFKVTFDVSAAKLPTLIDLLRREYPQLGFVAGSATSIDMSTKGMNKAIGLDYLSQKFRINPREMIAFGDSGNDVGMFKYVGQSFATATALPIAKNTASRVIGSSNDSAVQKEIWQILNS